MILDRLIEELISDDESQCSYDIVSPPQTPFSNPVQVCCACRQPSEFCNCWDRSFSEPQNADYTVFGNSTTVLGKFYSLLGRD